jgi:hypothetical protein
MNEDKQPQSEDLEGEGVVQPSQVGRRMSFPLIEGTHPAPPGKELTAKCIAAILEAQEAAHALRLAGFDVNEEDLLEELLNESSD